MAKVYAIINQKGGVGKSTTAINIAAGLKKKGFNVLAIDLDSQLCLSTTLNANIAGANILGVIIGDTPIKEAVQHTPEADVIPACRAIAQAESKVSSIPVTRQPFLLKEALEKIKADYDFIVIDTSPALGIITVNALIAADSIIIPALADTYSLDGISFLMETVRPVKAYSNPKLQIEGILLTMYNQRAVLSKEVTELAENIAQKIGSKVFKARIRRGQAVPDSQALHQSLFTYSAKAPVTEDYRELVEELIENK